MKMFIRCCILVFALCIGLQVFANPSDTLYSDTTITLTSTAAATPDVLPVVDSVEVAKMPPFKISSEGTSVQSVLRGVVGIVFLILIGFLLSTNKRKISWRIVIIGITLQIMLALLVLNVPLFQSVLDFVSRGFLKILSFTREGVNFLFVSLETNKLESALVTFAITILPTVIFFSALTSLLFFLGILQKVVYAMAWVMKKTMNLSGAESLSAAGNVFLGQTEAPLLIKPYIADMTKSEIMCLMTGGMATIAGGVLAAYVGFLGGGDPAQQLFYAKHLITASVLSAPAAIVASKLIIPETEEFKTEMKISKERIGANFLEAISNGTTEGLKLAVNVGAMLLVFTAMVYMFNFFLEGLLGHFTGLNEEIREVTSNRYTGLNMQFLLGYMGAPIAWLIGVPNEDMLLVGQLLGQKSVLNEFYAYAQMGEMKNAGLFVHEKSLLMTTYILCGFSNFASIGIQIGGIGSLAPEKRTILSQLGFRAMIGGTIACLLTSTIAGMFY